MRQLFVMLLFATLFASNVRADVSAAALSGPAWPGNNAYSKTENKLTM